MILPPFHTDLRWVSFASGSKQNKIEMVMYGTPKDPDIFPDVKW